MHLTYITHGLHEARMAHAQNRLPGVMEPELLKNESQNKNINLSPLLLEVKLNLQAWQVLIWQLAVT